MKQIVLVTLAVGVLLSGCVMTSSVTFDSDPQGADVYVDHRLLGRTPVTISMSNAIWESATVMYRMDGYREARIPVDKEVKATNLVVGLILWWPSLLWVYGPSEYQYVTLIEQR